MRVARPTTSASATGSIWLVLAVAWRLPIWIVTLTVWRSTSDDDEISETPNRVLPWRCPETAT
jgi:hypothetical protein